MSMKYTTRMGDIVVDDDNVLVTRYGKPFILDGVNEWRLVGYKPIGGVVGKDWANRLTPGCQLVFFDENMEGEAYESAFPEPPKIKGRVKYHFSGPVVSFTKI